MDMQQICRTCLKNSNSILPHFDLAEWATTGKTYGQLLKEYAQIKFNTDHEIKLPQEICAMCCGELKRIYTFITHAHECNNKLMNMVTNTVVSGFREESINQPGNDEGEDATHFKIENISVQYDDRISHCISVKNEPIANDDLLMKTIAQEAAEVIIESEEESVNTCSELREDNIKMELDLPSSSYTNHMPRNESLSAIEVLSETQKKILEHLTILRDNQAKMMSVLTKCTLTTTISKKSIFPVKDDKELRSANEYARDNFDECVNTIKQIISPEGLHRSFHRLFAGDITMNYNYDGIQNKKCFKEFKYLHNAIYESTAKEGYTFADYIKDVRISMKLCKNRLFKKKHDFNKKQIQLKLPV